MSDWDAMATDLAELRAQNPTTIAIRRSGTTLPEQTVRIARMGLGGRLADAGGVQASMGSVIVSGAPALDVRPGDRFTVGANLYEVVLVRPNRRAGTQVEAQLVQ